MSWYAMVYSGMRFNLSACIPKSNRFFMTLLQIYGFGMQVCIYPQGPMSWYALVRGGMLVQMSICIPKSN